jgi:L-seryl-tRNA(Ser) seleniumtransferase
VPTIETQVIVPPFANHVPHLLVRYDQNRVKVAPKEVVKRLREGTPSIELNPASGSTHGSAGLPVDVNTLVVGVWMLEPGEDVIVGKKLKEVLTQAI